MDKKFVQDLNTRTSIAALRNMVLRLESEITVLREELDAVIRERNAFQDQCIAMKIKQHLDGVEE